MENKYYTPEIEEFNIGFEFEFKDNGVWTKDKFICNSKFGFTFDDMPELANNSRVKYLDEEDIESLGWEFKDTNSNGDLYQKNNFYLYQKETMLNLEDRIIGKSLIESTHYFYGTIKNKSELIKLMQQLNIK